MSFGQAHSQAVVDRYPPGRAVTVHYHPAAPDRAVLEVGLDTAGLLGLLFLTPFNSVAFLFAGGALGWIRSRQLGRPVLGISVRNDGLGQTIRIYDVSPVMVALAVWGGVGFVSIFGYLLLTSLLSFEAALALGWIATLGAAVFAWWRARRKYTEIRRDLLHGRIEFRTPDGLSYSVVTEDLQPLQYSLRTSKDSDGGRVEKYPLGLPFFDPASQVSRTLPLPEQATEAAAQRFAEWLNGVLGVKS
jgi:hypothetical protein